MTWTGFKSLENVGTWYDLSRRLCADRRSWTGLPLERRNTEALLVAVKEEEILSKEKVENSKQP